jgi:Ser/Thr protein kinase RdoA (MazF antagonist)
MGQMLARIHVVLKPSRPLSAQAPAVEDTASSIRTADELLAFIVRLPARGDDETAAIRWLTGQRDWLASQPAELVFEPVPEQVIHGDYHDQNVVFNGPNVVGVFDWEKAALGDPVEELIRTLHLSFRLDPRRCNAFVKAYRSYRPVTNEELERAATNYAYRRDRSVWFFDELYRQGNERLRQLINRGPFVPFATSWDTVRRHL